MTISAIPPVHRRVPICRGRSTDSRELLEQLFPNGTATLYPSGTAALASALTQCAARANAKSPEAILPAYGCPDLVAACIAASVLPRLVDIRPSAWKYEEYGLSKSVNPNTIAIVAVNLLGIEPDISNLRAYCSDRHIPLIEDNAQFLPRTPRRSVGEYVVLSFGRGKPLNLLQGGALVISNSGRSSASRAAVPLRYRILNSWLAGMAFNLLTSPLPYRAFSMLPATSLGVVRYKAMTERNPLPSAAWKYIGNALRAYRAIPSYSDKPWRPLLGEWESFGIRRLASSVDDIGEPLRLVLLAPNKRSRDGLVKAFNRQGLGASRFYLSSLNNVRDIPDVVKAQGPFPNASLLADRLFTLPTHKGVTEEIVNQAHEIVTRWSTEL